MFMTLTFRMKRVLIGTLYYNISVKSMKASFVILVILTFLYAIYIIMFNIMYNIGVFDNEEISRLLNLTCIEYIMIYIFCINV